MLETAVPTTPAPGINSTSNDDQPTYTNTRRTAASMERRVDAGSVARALDEIMESLPGVRPYTIYRHLARKVGVHPTTVLRYHQGYLRTADATLHKAVTELVGQVRRGQTPAFDREETAGKRSKKVRSGRLPTIQVQKKIDVVLDALGLDEQLFLYRYLAERVGMHPTTVMRYHRGELLTAPRVLLDAVDELLQRIDKGEAVPFCRSPKGGTMVLRERTLEMINSLLEDTTCENKSSLFRALDVEMCLKAGTVARIYYDKKLRFVRADIHQALEKLASQTDYDPCLVYRVGERIHHHMFGPGNVAEKVHKNKIRVEFQDGKVRILSEAVTADPFMQMNSSGNGFSANRSLSTWGLAQ